MKFNLYLLPVYFTSFWHKGVLYFVVINGQTGKVFGGDATKVKKKSHKRRLTISTAIITAVMVGFYIAMTVYNEIESWNFASDQLIMMTFAIGLLGMVISFITSKGYF